MLILRISSLFALFALTFTSFAQVVPGKLCNGRYSEIRTGSAPYNAATLIFPSFAITCYGSLSARLRLEKGLNTKTYIQLEHKTRRGWEAVDQGWEIIYKAEPGTYRYRLVNTQSDQHSKKFNWKLEYAQPH